MRVAAVTAMLAVVMAAAVVVATATVVAVLVFKGVEVWRKSGVTVMVFGEGGGLDRLSVGHW